MKRHYCLAGVALFLLFFVTGCMGEGANSIIGRQAEVFMTKENELQFRFKLNQNILDANELYKVKVKIHNADLAAALNTDEITYGEAESISGDYIKANREKGNFIYMDPIPLQHDLHVYDIEKMIVQENAVSVEVIHEDVVVAQGYVKNFASEI